MIFGALIFAAVWCLIALLLRHYPETMAGYNTMPKHKRAKIDIQKLGRFISNAMFVGVPSVLLSPLMPSEGLYSLLLCWIPCAILVVAGIYVNVRKEKFNIK
jgi:lipopolysaccharide export LptBFGC system permease protein LptF